MGLAGAGGEQHAFHRNLRSARTVVPGDGFARRHRSPRQRFVAQQSRVRERVHGGGRVAQAGVDGIRFREIQHLLAGGPMPTSANQDADAQPA